MIQPDRTDPSENRDPRVYLAAERTMLAWIRTGIAMMGFGFVVARFGLFLREMVAADTNHPVRRPGLSLWVGIALVFLGLSLNIVAAVSHLRFRRRFERGEPFQVPRGTLTLIITIVVTLIGLTMMIYLIVLEQ